MTRGIAPVDLFAPAPPNQTSVAYHCFKRILKKARRISLFLTRCVILILAVLAGCQKSHALFTIDRLDKPDWPATAAGVGPASILVETKEQLPVLICPIDPGDCTEHTLEAGSWVIRLNVPDDEIWHVKIKP